MRISISAVAFISLNFLGSLSHAASFSQDLDRLRYALKFWNFSDSKLEEYLNPQRGAQNFRLPERRAPWAGNYFPMKEGGIAQRWQQDPMSRSFPDPLNESGFQYISQLSQDQLTRLSPAEKYDIVSGRYDLPVTQYELKNRGPLRQISPEIWEGFCNGVRCAGINLPEPKYSIAIANQDGIVVRFEPADLKALAGAAYFYVEKYSQLGAPSRSSGRAESQPNAAVFDAGLRYFLSVKRKAFVIDSHLGDEIWNESVIGYQRQLGSPESLLPQERSSYPWAQRKIRVTGHLETLGEMDIHSSNTTTTQLVADGQILERVDFDYTLYLDEMGLAREGVWNQDLQTLRGVDFVWFGGGSGADAHYRLQDAKDGAIDFEKLRGLFNRSQRAQCSRVQFARP